MALIGSLFMIVSINIFLFLYYFRRIIIRGFINFLFKNTPIDKIQISIKISINLGATSFNSQHRKIKAENIVDIICMVS